MSSRVTVADNTADSTVVASDSRPALRPRASWGAIFAGALVALATGVLLNLLGAAIGANTVDAVARDTPSASTFSTMAGIWLLLSNLIALFVGGYTAARLSGATDSTDSLLHGLSVWAIAFLLSAVLLGNLISGAASTAVRGASSVLGGVAQGAGQAVQAVAPAARDIDPARLVDRAQSALRGGGDPGSMTSDQRNAEIASLLGRRITDGPLANPERDRLNQLVGAEYGISADEAQRRVQAAEQQTTQALQQAEERARRAADAAASTAATAGYWAFGAMLLGALASVLGARMGTRSLVTLSRPETVEVGHSTTTVR